MHRRAQSMAEFVQLDGLEEVALGAGVQALDGSVGVVASGYHNNSNVRPAPLDLTYKPDAAATRHAQICHHDGRRSSVQQLNRLLRRGSGLALVTRQTGGANQYVEQKRFV